MLEGQRATLKCRSIGDPEPVVHWVSPDDRIVANSSRTSSFSNGTLDVLVTVARDDGTYTCIAINAAGEATAAVDLKIIPLPHRGGGGGGGGAGGGAGGVQPGAGAGGGARSNGNATGGIIRADPGSSDISTGKNGGGINANNGAGGRPGEDEGVDGGRTTGDGGADREQTGSLEEEEQGEDEGEDEEEGRRVGVQAVTSTSAQVRWDLGRAAGNYVVWMYQIQYNCTVDETLIYRSVGALHSRRLTLFSTFPTQGVPRCQAYHREAIEMSLRRYFTVRVYGVGHGVPFGKPFADSVIP